MNQAEKFNIDWGKTIEAQIEEVMSVTGESKGYYGEKLLEYLEDLEDAHIAEKELEDIRSGRSHTISLEEMEERNGA